jgi:hypothetical protein
MSPLKLLPLLVLAACASAPPAPPAGEMQLPPPTAEHKLLLAGVGEWEGTLTIWMPGQPEQRIAAAEVVEPVGDYWTRSRFTCDFMGLPFEGSAFMGFDPVKQRYVGTWVDNLTMELAVMEGEMSADGKLVMKWIARDPGTGQPAPHRSETVSTADSRVSTFFHGEGQGTKSMRIAMRRK